MEKIGFIGAYDKTDLILYVAKVLVELGKKVIVIDSTTNQKAKYTVPAISPTTSYVTQYEGMDIAVGLYSFEDIERYLGKTSNEKLDYDYALIDIDNAQMLDNFKITDTKHNYFVTSFDMYSLKKGIEILSGIKDTIHLTKILYSINILKEDDDYLNFLSLGQKIEWNETRIYMTMDLQDEDTIMQCQRVEKIKFKDLSSSYKDAILYLVDDIIKENKDHAIKKIFRQE